MTALIGGLCVGALWAFWATRQLIKRKRDIQDGLERKRMIMLKLEVLRKQQHYGKQTTTTDSAAGAARATAAGAGTAATNSTGPEDDEENDDN